MIVAAAGIKAFALVAAATASIYAVATRRGGGGNRPQDDTSLEEESTTTTTQVELLVDVVERMSDCGITYKEGSKRILNVLMSGDKSILTPIQKPWTDLDDEMMDEDALNAMFKDFSKAIYTDTLDGRDALNSGPPYYHEHWVMAKIKDGFPIINKRLKEIANDLNSIIDNTFVLHYCKKPQEEQATNSGGAGRHPDTFPHKKSWGRALDTVGNSLEEEKTMTFWEMESGESVTITVPHGTVILMTSVCAGNEEGKYQHSVDGAGGTMFFGIDFSMKRD